MPVNPLTQRAAHRGPKPKTFDLPRVKVRCLGPGKAEHFFMSANPSGERVCWRCRAKQDNMSLRATLACYAIEPAA
jgi:hypothetical protein